ncbi:MAG: GNAT family N-acetyltransferase [Pseudomonadota bacterium]
MSTIRPFRPDDAEAMLGLHGEAITRCCAATLSPEAVTAWLSGRTPEGYLRAIAKGERFWVATGADNAVIGFASWRDDELESLYVHPDHQGSGVGRALFAACEKDARACEQSLTKVSSTLNAQSFYESLGFHFISTGYWEKRGHRLPTIEMIRPAKTLHEG